MLDFIGFFVLTGVLSYLVMAIPRAFLECAETDFFDKNERLINLVAAVPIINMSLWLVLVYLLIQELKLKFKK
jgi:hypothetical protein